MEQQRLRLQQEETAEVRKGGGLADAVYVCVDGERGRAPPGCSWN